MAAWLHETVVVPVVVHGDAQRAPVIALPSEKQVTPHAEALNFSRGMFSLTIGLGVLFMIEARNQPPPLTLQRGFAATFLTLWDEQRGRLVRFRDVVT
jgi:hypothetical protein